MSTRNILGAVGAIVGAYFGNPQLGWMVGSAIGGAIDPEVIKGPSIGDIATQTSQEGVPRPIVYALSPPMAGNIIASGEPRTVRRRESGKGGPQIETEYVYRTYAIGICEGPISRIVRVWRNSQLVYDRLIFDPDFLEDTLLDGMRARMTGNNQTFMQRARFFLGSYQQLPSPDLEAQFGVGVTPAHRGTAYMVMVNEDLTDLRGAIPQYMFQVERCRGTVITTEVVALEDTLNDVPIEVATVPAGFLNPRDAPKRAWLDYEWGGIALNDGSEGLYVKKWKGEYIEDQIVLSAEGVTPTAVLTAADIDDFQFAFDRDMHVYIAYTLMDGTCHFYWWDPDIPGYTTMAIAGVTPRCCHDDVRDGATSDVVLAYVSSTQLFYRLQRERFQTDHIVADSLDVISGIEQIGMSTLTRFQFQLNYVDLDIPPITI